jgi:hypothetical protein
MTHSFNPRDNIIMMNVLVGSFEEILESDTGLAAR